MEVVPYPSISSILSSFSVPTWTALLCSSNTVTALKTSHINIKSQLGNSSIDPLTWQRSRQPSLWIALCLGVPGVTQRESLCTTNTSKEHPRRCSVLLESSLRAARFYWLDLYSLRNSRTRDNRLQRGSTPVSARGGRGSKSSGKLPLSGYTAQKRWCFLHACFCDKLRMGCTMHELDRDNSQRLKQQQHRSLWRSLGWVTWVFQWLQI